VRDHVELHIGVQRFVDSLPGRVLSQRSRRREQRDGHDVDGAARAWRITGHRFGRIGWEFVETIVVAWPARRNIRLRPI
jgi:hypothetical protein